MANKKDLKEFYMSKGMTNVPSDAICSDDDLAAEWNLIYRNGEHHVVQDPKVMFGAKETPYMLYVHTHNDVKRYIGLQTSASGMLLVWWKEDMEKVYIVDNTNVFTYQERDDITHITSIGNTLIINVRNTGLRYYLWKPSENGGVGQYKYLGNRLPEIDMSFILKDDLVVENEASHDGILNYLNEQGKLAILDGKQQEADDLLVGLYEKNKKELYRQRYFVNPFMIRYAVELFDGTFTHISAPMPMFPTVKTNTCVWLRYGRDGILHMSTRGFRLYYKQLTENLSDWSDIVKDIAIFTSDDIDVYDTNAPQVVGAAGSSITIEGVVFPVVDGDSISSSDSNLSLYRKKLIMKTPFNFTTQKIFSCMTNKTDSQLMKELSEQGAFYKLCNVGLQTSEGFVGVDNIIKSTDLANISTLPMLDHDDYHSRCNLEADSMYMYNKRLHLTGVKRGFFEGFRGCMPFNYSDGVGYNYVSRVYIHAGDGDRIVTNEYSTDLHQGIYYYYPDPRAYKVEIFRKDAPTQAKGGGMLYSYELKAHPLLNGAYYMRNTLPTEKDNLLESKIGSGVPTDSQSAASEVLPNEVWVSEVNNPFTFNASGVNTVGQGKIMAIISNTTALSQGQFGQFPLICFSTDGVWALEVGSTGIYSSAKAISREICNNKNSVVATDSLVFFTSEKGLMLVEGSVVKLATPQMGGKTYVPVGEEIKVFTDNGVAYDKHWLKFLKNCKIAYDYRDSLLWIINPSEKQCYIYSIESGCVSMKTLTINIVTVVNDYPDSIIYGSYLEGGEVRHAAFSLVDRPDINEDKLEYSAFIITRPLKVGDAMALKGIVTRKLVMNIDNTNGSASEKVIFRMYGSDDMEKWAQLKSFGGRGFKYYKFILLFDNLIATDTFSGVIGGFFYRYEGRLR